MALAASLFSCGGGSSPGGGVDAGPRPCSGDNDCPSGQSCIGGYCQGQSLVDAAVDQAAIPKMLVSPTVLDYGSPVIGAEYTKVFSIANVGSGPLTVSAITLLEDRTVGAFTLSHAPLPLIVAAGDSLDVPVVLRPNDENLPVGSIKVHSDDPTTGDATIDLLAHQKGAPQLSVCAQNAAPPPDCTVTSDNNPVIEYGAVPYGTSVERVVSARNTGDGNLPIEVSKVALTDPTHFTVTLFQFVDDPANPGQKLEQPVTLPFYLSAGDSGSTPPVPPTELRVHVAFTADGVDGDVPHVSLQLDYTLPDNPPPPAQTSIPVRGTIAGCKPGDVDAGVPDGGADPQTDPLNCGTCGNVCAVTHGTPACVGGHCAVASCDQHYGDCNNTADDGCETNLLVTKDHCGTCATACVDQHGTNPCQSGACKPSCDNGYDDCDGNPANGCETRTTLDVNNCGLCGTRCVNPNGTTACSGGLCVPSCSFGAANCDGNPINGCEVNTQVDVNNCGGCGQKCVNPAGSVSCAGGVCQAGCDPGYANCDGNPTNGCETNVLTDRLHCGSCTVACTNAGGTTDCQAGVCKPVCSSGFGDCDNNHDNGCESNLANDINNCGGCQRPCTNAQATGSTCVSSACTAPQCISGYGNCDGDNWNGCEQVLNVVAHCGTCTNACTNAHGSTSCDGTACKPVCDAGFADCNANPSDGCETDLAAVTLCGTCTLDAQCVTGFFCNGSGRCEKKHPDGGACGGTKECASNFCVDGVCCSSACTGQCQACTAAKKGSGGDGTCGNVAANTDPDQECAGPLTCDGGGACRTNCTADVNCEGAFYCSNATNGTCLARKSVGIGCAADTVDSTGNHQCTTSSCVDGVCCSTGCTGTCVACSAAKKGGGIDGTCGNVAVNTDPDAECGGGLTCDGAGACRPDCTADLQCESAYFCTANAGGACLLKKPVAQACGADTVDPTGNHQCTNGTCVDGFCCNTACTGACQACSATKKGSGADGTCGNIAGNTDPDTECSSGYTCDGVGHCRTSCTTDANCAGGFYCTSNGGGSCAAKKVDGIACASDPLDPSGNHQCVNSHCVDGYCCDTACSGACDVCNGAALGFSGASNGTCAIAPVGWAGSPACTPYLCGGAATCASTCAADADCIATDYCDASGHCAPRKTQGGACNPAADCKVPGACRECQSAGGCVDGFCCDTACSGGSCDVCNGAALGFSGAVNGTCVNAPAGWAGSPTCDPFVCGGGAACPGACAGDADCTATQYCDATGHCVPQKVQGNMCNPAADCKVPGACRECNSAGGCVDGFCCNTACSVGSCDVCNGGTLGFSGATNGTCSTAPAGWAGSPSCAPYFCGGGATCAATCTTDGDCALTAYCDNTGHCAPQKVQGNACNPAAECKVPGSCRECAAAGGCIDGYCCNTACNGGSCDVCNGAALGLTGAVNGTCFNAPAGWTGSPSCTPYFCGGSATCAVGCAGDADCIAADYCSAAGQCVPRKAQGNACNPGTDCKVPGSCRECNTAGGCVDGFCCDAACSGGACDVCNGAVLGFGGAVNGTCTSAPAGWAGSPSCTPYFCSGGAACATTCAGDGECIAGDYCDGTGHCVPRKSQGSTCNPSADCKVPGSCRECTTAGGCVDGYCCDAACNGGACDVCNGAALGFTGAVNGTCASAPAGWTGNPACSPYYCSGGPACASTCAADADCIAADYCDASGHCAARQAQGSACNLTTDCKVAGACRECSSAGGCVDGYCCDTTCSAGSCDVCNGAALGFTGATNGTCSSAPVGWAGNPACTPYFCGGGVGCASSCAGDSDCVAADYCDATGHCVARKAQGGACNLTTDCKVAGACRECGSAGGCVDGYCCDTACNAGSCDVCNGAALGFSGATNGTCVNAPPSWAGSPSCTPYFCGGGAGCAATCATDANCVAVDYCDATGHCVARKAQGSGCNLTTDCKVAGCRECNTAGGCVDGFCCNTACAGGACDVCNGAALGFSGAVNGTCMNAPDGWDGDPSCAPYLCGGGAVCTAGCAGDNDCVARDYCDASGQCVARKAQGSACNLTTDCKVAGACRECSSAGGCVDGYCCDTACNAGSCDVCNGGALGFSGATNGTCVGAPAGWAGNPSCTPYFCGGGVGCATACAADGDCIAADYCDGTGHCVARKAQGSTCNPAADCKVPGACRECNTVGGCVDGYCCNTSCAGGACDVCNGGALGFTGATNGTCFNAPDGWPGSPSCAPYFCAGGVACGATCAADDDCVSGDYCDATSHCVPQKALGSACNPPSDCKVPGSCRECNTAGGCVDGYCCNTTCSAGSCDVCNGAALGFTGATNGTCSSAPAGWAGSPSCTPYFCGGGTTCASTCATDSDCVAADYCDSTSHCAARKTQGNACNLTTDCKVAGACRECNTAGGCVDGYCCDTTCSGGSCDVCNGAALGLSGATNGTCFVAAAGWTGSPSCSPYFCGGGATCASTCTTDADCVVTDYCDATGHCAAQKLQGNACNLAADCKAAGCRECATVGGCVDGYCCNTTCSGGSCDVCNGAVLGLGGATNGTCFTAPAGFAGSPTCSPYVCGGGAACPATCTSDAQCAAADYCDATGHCVAQKAQGNTCNLTTDCKVAGACRECGTAGGCVDGFCCNTSCNGGSCDVCNGATLGFGGAVDGTCSNAPAGWGGSPSCAPYACGGGASCGATCATDGDCIATNYCDATGHCVVQKVQGNACNPSADCKVPGSCRECGTVGGCVDGYCCNTACAGGACDVCNGAALGLGGATNGTCFNAPAGWTGSPSCTPYFCGGGATCAANCATDNDCIAADYCDSTSHCVARKAQGSACNLTTDCKVAGACRECSSAGGCVDGYCCDTTCSAGSCDVCNGGALGFTGATNGTCFNAPNGWAGSPSCTPYFCGGGASCTTTCADDNDCIAVDYCDATSHCVSRKAQGNACNPTVDCKVPGSCRECNTAGGCVDGYCCNTACNGGACDVCNGGALAFTGATNGTCFNAPAGWTGNPSCTPYFCGGAVACAAACATDSDCVAADYCDATGHCVPQKVQGNACNLTTDCKVAGACRECGTAGGCVDGYCCNTTCAGGACDVCNGAALGLSGASNGDCFTAPAGFAGSPSCTPYVCGGGVACPASCTSDAQCAAADYCDATGHCVPQKVQGNACNLTTDCKVAGACRECGTAGGCVDGYCCNTSCNGGACDVCNGAALGLGGATNGTCFNAPAGWAGNPSCSPYFCGGGATCAATCASDNDCVAADYCDNTSHCVPRKAQGNTCNPSADCKVPGSCRECNTAGGCVDGYCCDTTCSAGSCDVCNGGALGFTGATNGTCFNAPAGWAGSPSCTPYFCSGGSTCDVTCTSDNDCIATDYCDATSHCVPQKVQGNACSPAADCKVPGTCRECSSAGGCVDGFCCNTTCAGGSCDVCDGAALGFGGMVNGTCANAPVTYGGSPSCAPYFCGGGVSCAATCASDADCVAADYCDATGHCVVRKAQGSSCTPAVDCKVPGSCRECNTAGGCVDGFCCDTACSGGSCDVCNGAALGFAGATNGTCSNANAGWAGSPSCSPYVCTGAAACPASCTSDAQCAAADYCNAAGQCVARKGQGSTCNLTTDCKVPGSCRECSSAGGCVDGFCCDTACNGGSCDVCNGASLGLGGATNGTCFLTPAGFPGSPNCGAPYLCNGASTSCPTTCGNDSHCQAGYYCSSAGTCVPQKTQGSTCNTTTDCLVAGCRECGTPGGCVDGYCCDSTCGSSCVGCNVATHEGTCYNRPIGVSDPDTCAAPNSVCNGAGVCKTATGYSCAGDANCLTNHCCSNSCRDITNDVYNCGGCGTNCTALANVVSSSCVASACVINSCAADYYNVNGTWPDGCECHDNMVANHTCTSPASNTAYDLGSIDDNNGATGLVHAGNLPYNGVVYYKFKAYNSRWNASLMYNPYNLRVGFNTNAGMKLEVMGDSCSADAVCGGGSQPVMGQISGGQYYQVTYNVATSSPNPGENPCYYGNWPGYNNCVNHGPPSAGGNGAETYFIKVSWNSTPATCAAASYTVQVLNGP
ncbi:MAG TPA: choice-of-anchor D domain-containing protein [Polyangia bacterium]